MNIEANFTAVIIFQEGCEKVPKSPSNLTKIFCNCNVNEQSFTVLLWYILFSGWLNFCRRAAIHAEAPEFVEMSTEQEILVTGIKVVDLLAPYAKGGKIGMFQWPLVWIIL